MTTDYGDLLRSLADYFADLADKAPVRVVSELNASSDLERRIADARRAAALAAVDQVGGQSALARQLGITRQSVNQLIAGSRRKATTSS